MSFQTISGRGYKSQSREKIVKMHFFDGKHRFLTENGNLRRKRGAEKNQQFSLIFEIKKIHFYRKMDHKLIIYLL